MSSTPPDAADAYHRRNDESLARQTGYAATSAENAMKAAGLINGGAVVALLALVGNFADAEPLKQVVRGALPECLTAYILGLAGAAVASGFAYCANLPLRLGHALRSRSPLRAQNREI